MVAESVPCREEGQRNHGPELDSPALLPPARTSDGEGRTKHAPAITPIVDAHRSQQPNATAAKEAVRGQVGSCTSTWRVSGQSNTSAEPLRCRARARETADSRQQTQTHAEDKHSKLQGRRRRGKGAGGGDREAW